MAPPLPPLPSGLQALLARAARHEGFRRELLAGRDAAAGEVDLTAAERAILRAVPIDQLRQMITAVTALPPLPERRDFLRDAGSAAVVLLGGAALGAAALGARESRATPPGPPTGIRPDPPHFTGDVDIVDYRTVSGPVRSLPDQGIERTLADRSLRAVPKTVEGRLSFRLVVEARGHVTQATPLKPPADLKLAAEKMAEDLRQRVFRPVDARTTMTFAVVLTRRRPLREWSGRVDLVDLDVAGPQPETVRRAVRDLLPQFVARLKADERDRPYAGKVRYAFRLDPDGKMVDPTELTKNTSVPHIVAMGIRQLLADSRFPKAPGGRWCRFSLVLVPSEPTPR
jgi:hypothetical protein